MNDRIKLAEARGWRKSSLCGWHLTNAAGDPIESRTELPDPFTDANDDYAVLEWARTQDAQFQHDFQCALANLTTDKWFQSHLWNYQIGDYARAALKVLGD